MPLPEPPKAVPRASGGDPCGAKMDETKEDSSPRKRGSSLAANLLLRLVGLFPAQAGVIPVYAVPPALRLSVPRASGGDPC